MPQYHNNILCVTYEELTDGVISVANYRNLYNRKSINTIRRACLGTSALVEYMSLPSRIKEVYVAKYGDPTDKSKDYTLKGLITTDHKAEEFYTNYKLADGRFLTADKVQEYVTNASMLRAINIKYNDLLSQKKARGGSTAKTWAVIIEAVAKIKEEYNQAKDEDKKLLEKYNHTLPDCGKRLKDKLRDFQAKGYESLISGKFLNKNSKKVDDIQKEALLRTLLSDHRNLDCEQLAKLYNMFAEKDGWDKISGATVLKYRVKWNLNTYGRNHGEKEFNNAKAMHVKRKAPTYPLYYWTLDGWDVELMYQKTTDNGTTYTNRLTAVIVLDASIKYPIGYAIGNQETAELIKEAMRNSIKHTRELFGEMYKPQQLQSDNFGTKGKSELKSFYKAATELYTPAEAGNAKSKVIEPYFKYLNKTYCQLKPNWSGFGLQSSKLLQPNAEKINKIKFDFPDENCCIKQIEDIINRDRQAKVVQFKQLFEEMPAEHKVVLSESDFYYYLGKQKKETNKLTKDGFIPTIEGIERDYDCFDVEFRKHYTTDWKTYYDPKNLEKILVVNEDSTRRFLLEEKYIQPMALIERKEGDSEQLERIKSFNRSMKAEIIEEIVNDNEMVSNMFERQSVIGETLSKLLITDSNGQHKLRKSEARLNGAVKLLKKQNKQEEKEKELSWKEEQEKYIDSKLDLSKYNL